MLSRLILLFTLVPAMELILLVYLGREIGFWPTVALIVVPGVVGAVVAKSQGTRVLRRIQADVAAGRVPAYGLIDAADFGDMESDPFVARLMQQDGHGHTH